MNVQLNNELAMMCKSIRTDLETLYNAAYTDSERDALEADGLACELYSYFEDVLDYEYIIGARHDFRGVKVWLTLGGPNIWLDTQTGYIEGRWGTANVAIPISDDICEEINCIFEDIYSCV